MKKFKLIGLTVGIYDTNATITRHRNGDVTIRVPFINWVDNSGCLAFYSLVLSGDDASLMSKVFSDEPPIVDNGYGDKYELVFSEALDNFLS